MQIPYAIYHAYPWYEWFILQNIDDHTKLTFSDFYENNTIV